ncbi:MAG: FAD binding domain-containing protein [Candidatus Dormibacteraeota bacterium]|nr:FAD binding domain-containing protein [Candidatus Dormibacteraeota bacterium]
MDVLQPRTLEEALGQKAAYPGALALNGGTDIMVEINFGRARPETIIDVSRLQELKQANRDNGHWVLGAGTTYTDVIRQMSEVKPLVEASRTVGSPQIRNRGTVGGNLGTASPAGDALPVLAAFDAEVILANRNGRRTVPWNEFLKGPKKTSIAPDELIVATRWKRVRGSGSFSKIGTRNAMVISLVGFCLVIDEDARRVRVALGSVAPTIVRATDGEDFISRVLDEAGAWDDPSRPLPETAWDEFATRVAKAAKPIDDVRGTAAYRTHACKVLAKRSLSWALEDRRLGRWL